MVVVVLCILAGIGSVTVLKWAWRWAGSHPNQIAAREAEKRLNRKDE